MEYPVKPKPSNPIKAIALPIVIILIAIAIYTLVNVFASKPEKKPIDQKAPLVDVISLKAEDIRISIYSQGDVSPITESMLTSEVAGKVTQVSNKFASGGYFVKGETLLNIDDTDVRIALIEAKAQLKVAEAALLEESARVKQAKEEWLLSGRTLSSAPTLALREPQLKRAEAEVELAEAAVTSATTLLSRTTITAPYNAVVQNVNVDIGQYVNVGSTLASIFSIEKVKVRLPIKSQDVPYLDLPAINNQILKVDTVNTSELVSSSNIVLSNTVNKQVDTWQALLIGHEGVVDALSRVQYVIAVVEDPYNIKQKEQSLASNAVLPIGSFVNAEIAGKTLTQVTRIPRSAVIGKNTVYILTPSNTLDIQSFDIIRSDEHFVYTQSETLAHAKVITNELSLPVKGMPLREHEEALSTPSETIVDATSKEHG